MKNLSWIAIAALLVSVVGPTVVVAQNQGSDTAALEEYIKVVRGDTARKRDSAMRTLLELTPEEEKAFRPLQKAYDSELKKLAKQDLELTREFGKVYDKLTGDSAAEMGSRFFKLEQERLALQQRIFKQMAQEVSPVVAVQFIQLQRQFETMAEFKTMTYAPLAVKN